MAKGHSCYVPKLKLIREEGLIMKSTMEILERINQNSNANKNEVFTKLYRYLLREDIYYVAYQNLYANKGASAKGVNDDTADGFSEQKVTQIIKSLSDETYKPSPIKTIKIQKQNETTRQIGLSTFTDKLVQEVVRMILEAIYEPLFWDCSHGFRPNKSCHTALHDVKFQYSGIKWFIKCDIANCFDNINHTVLIDLLNCKIKDARFIQLIWKFLKAGYMENWQYHRTYSGVPQGGILSPILSNIYLHELDKFVMELKNNFYKPKERNYTPEYCKAKNAVAQIKKKIAKADGNERTNLIADLKDAEKKMKQLPFASQTDKVIQYVRYADDFLIGIKGSKEDCQQIKNQLVDFLDKELHMSLEGDKTSIIHSSEYVRFLGYDVCVRRSHKMKRVIKNGKSMVQRTLNNSVDLSIPFDDKIHKFLFAKGIVEQESDGNLVPVHRKSLLNFTDLEIVQSYNAELRGLCNYYSLASNYNKLQYFAYLMEYSCLKTLAGKHKCTISKIRNEIYKDGKGKWCIPYENKYGKQQYYFADYMKCKKSITADGDKIRNTAVIYATTATSLESRLKAHKCELCGCEDENTEYQVHHINKVKNLDGKKHWERIMIAKHRKTIVVCETCHHKIHYSD